MLGEKHPDTALSYSNLAFNLNAQGKFADAQPLCQKALDLRLDVLGEKHPDTAISYNNLAANLNDQGEYAVALALYRTSLELRREFLGETHPDTAAGYFNLAANLCNQGKYGDSQPRLIKAAAAYEGARLTFAVRGLDRAVFGDKQSPYRLLATVQARSGLPEAAWISAEADLARGLSDEAARRKGAVLLQEEESRRAAVAGELNQLAQSILQLVVKQSPSEADAIQLADLQAQRRECENELTELAVVVSRRELATLSDVQAALSPGDALVMWVDVTGGDGRLQEHWGCALGPSGEPRWEPLTSTGDMGQWTAEDVNLPEALKAAAAGNDTAQSVARFASRLFAQRIEPLEKHLQGVKRLLVVPVGAMAGVPVELLTEKYTVSYVPSGSFLARSMALPAPAGDALLALGDPVFPPVQPPDALPLPPGGLLLTQVLPGGNADQARLRPGDVLLKYAGAELTAVEQLGKLIQQHGQDTSIPIVAWREGATADRDLAPGKLGVVLDRQPAPEVIAAKRKTDQMLLALKRGSGWAELPGSAIEVARLTKLVGEDQTTGLTRSAASEQELEQLRTEGKLAEFRYLHFATHGAPNNARSFESALILAQDQILKDLPLAGGRYYDGKLTANEVLDSWDLNAELVTLSTCDSALGRPGGGDGVLGFAQAFLLAGSRAVCLSLWKADDTATALLMDRFYQNLLGKRAGLDARMPKAAALEEAKKWLRGLSFNEAGAVAAEMSKGVFRGAGEEALKLIAPSGDAPAEGAGDHPYSHPRYWAAFVLIGDPD